ncbi:MAG: 50S ribosomal protein L21 [Clostridia bacterium]|nr:50S ribosomal protein L21 [Clostridia bacterium]
MYAIFDNGNKQYKVSVGDTVKVEKLNAEVGSTVTFPVVLTADEKGIAVGKEVEKVTVSAEVVNHGKEKKIIVFKYKAKKNERKKQGHRQPYTTVKITAIGEATSAPAKKKAAPKKTATAKTAAKEAAGETAAE